MKCNPLLDIIIPYYNNEAGLNETLKSIEMQLNPQIKITIMDDNSDTIPSLNNHYDLWTSNENMGPGVQRQMGMEVTSAPYIMFIDTGDTLLPDGINKVINNILSHPDINIFIWPFLINKTLTDELDNHLHGKIYKRDFLNKYNIIFSKPGSYSNEDVGFNQACRLILEQYDPSSKTILVNNDPIMRYDTITIDSLTRKDNHTFIYKKQNLGLAINAIHVFNIGQKNNVSTRILNDYVNNVMCSEYFYFYRTFEERPEFLEQAWDGAKYYYDNLFYIFAQANKVNTQAVSSRIIKHFKKTSENWRPTLPINIYRFIKDLSSSEKLPEYYLTLKK